MEKMEKGKRKGVFRHFTAPKVVSGVLICAAFAFLVFFFAPMEIVYNNRQDFTVNPSDIFKPMFLLSAALTAGFSVVMLGSLMISDKLFFVISRIGLGGTLALYIQSLFLNGDMTAITGDALYNVSKAKSVMNMCIFVVIVFLPLAVNLIYRHIRGKSKNSEENGFLKVLPAYLCGALIVMLGFGLSDTARKTDTETAEKSYDKTLSYIPMTSLSKENNVIAFLVDRFDSKQCDELLEKYPDLYEELSGFTFYQNNISHYSNTFPSVPSMLTGHYYKGYEKSNAAKTEYLDDAWKENTVLDKLTENGIKVNLALDSLSTIVSAEQLDGRCSNLIGGDDLIKGFNYFGMKGILRTMTKLSLGKLTPYCMKGIFAGKLGSDLSASFIEYDNSIIDSFVPSGVGTGSDRKFYDFIKSHSFDADSSSPVFTMVHLNGSHSKSDDISGIYAGNKGKKTDIYTTTCGELEIVFTYLREMKKLGVFDNSTIIIFADHGRVNLELDVDGKDHMEHENVSVMMIKPAGASVSEQLKLDPDSELSNDYMAASLLEYFGLDHSQNGYSFNDIINGKLHVDRIFNPFRWMKNNNYAALNEYRVTGNARDFSNWTELE